MIVAFQTQRQGTQSGKLTELILLRIEARICAVLLLAHGVDCLGLHVAEVAVLGVHEAWPGGPGGFAEGVGVVRRDVIDDQFVAILLLEGKLGFRSGALWLAAFAERRCCLRELQ